MNTQLAKLKKVAIFLSVSAISTALIPAVAHADWSIKGLGTLGFYSNAFGINDSGQVVGDSVTASGNIHAFITGSNGIGMTDIGTLGGDLNYSRAKGINDSGQVVGVSHTASDSFHAFITGPNGIGMTDIGTLGGGISFSSATGINDSGQVVGNSTIVSSRTIFDTHAFITGSNGIGVRRQSNLD